MPAPRETDLLVQAARLYYEQGLSQGDVAAAMNISRSNVSRVLASARERGIVEISIHDPGERLEALERKLVQRFGLRDCRIAPAEGGGGDLHAVGRLGASWLVDTLDPGGSVGLSWGSTVQAVVDNVPNRALPDVTVLPLVGGLSVFDAVTSGEALVRNLAAKLGARQRSLYAPALVESKTIRDAFMGERSIRETLAAAASVDCAIVGIGAAGVGASGQVLAAMNLSEPERDEFDAASPVGDMCARYFDVRGAAVCGATAERAIVIGWEDLRRIPSVVGVCTGIHKLSAALGALRSGLVDVFIADAELGAALLEQPLA
ncbi:sugar-binding transcriptional regulator [Micrococcales bacterium 31B]|nr:sugar-binding transcriptional regulator [Micrococcales bacterium 31B]